MGIRLDWEIEAEQEHHQHTEDPETRGKRWRARLRFLLVLFVMLAVIGGAVGVFVVRLRQVEGQIEQLLRDTVTAEVAALRIGDRAAFLAMQRSATEDWTRQQDANFAKYQVLKQTQDLNLSGRIIDVKVDGTRARVRVEEIISGVPYGRVWFYWRYEDGWRHVPPDYTFWGDARTANAESVLVHYAEVDEAVAEALAGDVSDWLRSGCSALGCGSLSRLTVEIVPNPAQEIDWLPTDAWTLQVPSPSVNGARLDMPFDTDMQIRVASLLAERLVGDFTPSYPADAYYLRQAIISWLVMRFAQVQTNSFLIKSLADNYGESAVGRLLHAMQPDSSVSIISSVTGTALDAATLDWRDFLTWRLVVENDLIAQQLQEHYLLLYDTTDASVRDQAYLRYGAGATPDDERRVVISAISERDGNNTPQLRAVVRVNDQEEEVTFRLVDGVWKRAS
jgi:hypothetical protein